MTAPKDSPLFGPIDQIGIVVEDLDAAVASRIRHMGLGPWTVFRGVTMDGKLRGEPIRIAIDVALAYRGDIQIELIQPVGHSPSPYRDDRGAPLLGMHHLAWIVDDLDAAVEGAVARGLKPVFEASNATTRVAYLEAEGDAGVLYEFIEGVGMAEMVAAGIAAARDWDGSDPVTTIRLDAAEGP